MLSTRTRGPLISDKDDKQATAFDVHHSTEVIYPGSFDLGPWYESILLPPINNGYRYAPEPLVSDNSVIDMAGRTNNDETSFVSLAHARMDTTMFWSPLAKPKYSIGLADEARLVSDMETLISCHGDTRLCIDTFLVKGHANPVIHIWRRTRLTTGDRDKQDATTYQTLLREFLKLKIKQDWYLDTIDLIYRKSVRAARHVHLNHQLFDAEDPADWRIRQTIRLESFDTVSSVVDTQMLKRLEEQQGTNPACPICGDEFESLPTNQTPKQMETTATALQLTACKHIMCASCLTSLCSTNGVNMAKCPLCRSPIAPPNLIQQRHYFSVDARGTYQPDDRYTPWENTERSLADLDVQRAQTDNTTLLPICPEILQEFLTTLITHAKAEPESITPRRHNPVFTEEFRLAESSIRETLSLLHGMYFTPSRLWDILLDDLKRVYCEAFATSPLAKALRSDVRDVALMKLARKWETGVELFGTQMGVWEFVVRCVNWVVNFGKVRGCGCEVDGLHLHGECRVHVNLALVGRGVGGRD